jgi:DNA-binding transcriptional regulator YhcF (GntR family)
MKAWEKFSSDFDDKTPIYKQIYMLFSCSFARGQIEAGERIPSIRDMALRLKVNANTMQRVYQELERDELIKSRRGTGYFFTDDESMVEKVGADMAREAIERFLEEMYALGFTKERIISELSEQIKESKKESGVRENAAAN